MSVATLSVLGESLMCVGGGGAHVCCEGAAEQKEMKEAVATLMSQTNENELLQTVPPTLPSRPCPMMSA